MVDGPTLVSRKQLPSLSLGTQKQIPRNECGSVARGYGNCRRLWQPIVEETLTSGKYVSLFLISILYIYKIKKITWRPTYFWRNMQKLAIRKNCSSEENKCTLFVVILQLKTLIAIVYRPQEKNMQITLNVLWIFIIIHHFSMATFKSHHMGRWKT